MTPTPDPTETPDAVQDELCPTCGESPECRGWVQVSKWGGPEPCTNPLHDKAQIATLKRERDAAPGEFLSEVLIEVERARMDWPGREHMYVALAEEVGEVAKALLEGDREGLRAECIQVAAMAMRVAEEGDADFDA